MNTASSSLPALVALDRLDDSLLEGLRGALRQAEYTGLFIGRVEQVAPRQLDRVRLPVVHWWLRRQAEPAAVLARLFAYADPLSAEELGRALPEQVVAALVEAGLLERSGELLRARARLMPFEGLWIASDEMDGPGDPVMGPGATTTELARAMAVGEGQSVLDVGCGAGSLALLAKARGAGEVVGTDLLGRAIDWSRFNARLNGLEATFLAGDLTAPVEGRRFDLVLSQPPYVIKAAALEPTTYLHGGQTGDEIAFRLIRALPEVLEVGGRGLLLFDAPVFGEASVEGRLREALGALDLQVYAVAAKGHGPEVQAIGYSSIRSPDLGRSYAAAVSIYCEHLGSLGITGSAHVLLLLRRPAEGEARWLFIVETDEGLGGWGAEALAEVQAGAQLAALGDQALLDARVGLDPTAWVVQEQSVAGARAQRVRLRFDKAHKPEVELSEGAAQLIDVLLLVPDGAVRTMVKRYAKAARARPEEVQGAVLGFLRGGLASGVFVPRRP